MTAPFRVYVVGLPKTGTSSMGEALRTLGWNFGGYSFGHILESVEHGYPETLDAQHDGLADMAILPYWMQAAQRHPTARFILTIRDEQSWIESLEHWWKGCLPDTLYHQRSLQWLALFGCARFNKQQALNVKRMHQELVLTYFGHKTGSSPFWREAQQNRLLVFNAFAGMGWEHLCEFLGVPQPNEPFPHIKPRLGC